MNAWPPVFWAVNTTGASGEPTWALPRSADAGVSDSTPGGGVAGGVVGVEVVEVVEVVDVGGIDDRGRVARDARAWR